MGNQNAKYVWPLIGAVILIVLVALYIDDRRKMAHEESAGEPSEQAAHDMSTADAVASAPDEPDTGDTDVSSAVKMTNRMTGLTSHVEEHRGYSGSIESYLNALVSQEDGAPQATSLGINEYLNSADD